MNSNVTLTNSSQFYLANEEIFLRSIPAQIKIGELSDDALRLLVYYISKAGPFELALESGYFNGTLDEWLTSLKSNLQFRAVVDEYTDLATFEGASQGDLVFVKSTNMAYIYDGGAFTDEANGISITGPSAYDIAITNGFQGTVQDFLDSLRGEDGDDGLPGVDGSHGLSAYEIAQEAGFTGTESEWLASLVGVPGQDGADGEQGAPGINGQSAYDLAVESGFEGTLEDWLVSLVGAKGQDGVDGTNGIDGTNGTDGQDGQDGKSAYELAVELGFEGDEAAWILSLKGDKGDKGEPGEKGDTFTFEDLTPEQVLSLKGEAFTYSDFTPEQLEGLKGPQGVPGTDGEKGDAFTYADFTPEQLEGLKGPKGDQGEPGPAGQDGVDGTNGTNGTNGKSAYELAVELGFVGDEAAWILSLKGQDGQDAPAVDVTSTTLTGYIEGTNETVVETDTLLQAIAKLQAQNDALAARILALESA